MTHYTMTERSYYRATSCSNFGMKAKYITILSVLLKTIMSGLKPLQMTVYLWCTVLYFYAISNVWCIGLTELENEKSFEYVDYNECQITRI